MLVNLIFFRHGETDWNKNYLVQGCSDIPLNSEGEMQAKELGYKLSNVNLDVIISSPLKRAMKTAEYVQEKHNKKLNIQEIDDLREINFGDAEGITGQEIREKYNDIISVINDYDHEMTDLVCIPNGETRKEVIDRVKKTIENYIFTNDEYNVIAISTHGGVLGAILKDLKKENRRFSNCEVLEVKYSKKTEEFII